MLLILHQARGVQNLWQTSESTSFDLNTKHMSKHLTIIVNTFEQAKLLILPIFLGTVTPEACLDVLKV